MKTQPSIKISPNLSGNRPIHVGISEIVVSEANFEIKTTLGSCVAVLLYTTGERKLCSLSHFLLPQSPQENIHNNGSVYEDKSKGDNFKLQDMKYGDRLIPRQIRDLKNRVKKSDTIYAKIFGGANSPGYQKNRLLANIGNKNVALANSILEEYHIEVTGSSVGGTSARTVSYVPEQMKANVYEMESEQLFIV